MTLNEILTLIALVGGPVTAVLLTRYVDQNREKSGRRMDVFRTLMRTRRAPKSPYDCRTRWCAQPNRNRICI
jgi:hypothetical protein